MLGERHLLPGLPAMSESTRFLVMCRAPGAPDLMSWLCQLSAVGSESLTAVALVSYRHRAGSTTYTWWWGKSLAHSKCLVN